LGVLALLKKHFKDFECHASTQMSIYNSFGTLAVKNMLIDNEGHRQDVLSDYIVQKAANRPTDRNVMKDKLERLGATAYEISHSEYRIDDGIYVSLSVLNDARRNATGMMDNTRAVCYPERKLFEILPAEKYLPKAFARKRRLSVSASTLRQVEAALREGADRVVYSPLKISGDKEILKMLLTIEKRGWNFSTRTSTQLQA